MHVSLLDVYKPRETWIHALDPRVKIVGTILFILTAVSLPEDAWVPYLWLLLIILVLASVSRLGAGFTVRRGFIALPFILAAVPLPFLIPGEPILTLPLLGWTATDAGLQRFAAILVRTWIAVQAGVLLSATTPVPELLWALSRLRVPRVIVATTGFMIRYLFVLVDEALRMIRARSSRSPVLEDVKRPGVLWQGRTAGMMVGSLFLRSLERSERVFAAMAARGYDGELRTLETPTMRAADWTALIVSLLVLAGILILGLRG